MECHEPQMILQDWESVKEIAEGKLCFLAGAVTGDKEHSKWAHLRMADNIQTVLFNYQVFCFSPHANSGRFLDIPGVPEDEVAIHHEKILKACDILLVLPEWETSSGTKKEINQAQAMDIPVFFLSKKLVS